MLGLVQSAELGEDFTDDPLARGWKIHGDAALFKWQATSGHLLATWDSSRSNSYFALPLGRELDIHGNFKAAWTLKLRRIEPGVNPSRPGTFQLAVGFLNWADATSPRFVRGSGTASPNLMEWNYFPELEVEATISLASVDSSAGFEAAFAFDLPMEPPAIFSIEIEYLSAQRTFRTRAVRDGEPFLDSLSLRLPPRFGDFRLDTFAINSYSDDGQHPLYGGSLLAEGEIDNVRIWMGETPPLAIRAARVGAGWTVTGPGTPGWTYALQRSPDFRSWQTLPGQAVGTDSDFQLHDPLPPPDRAFYRVVATAGP